MKQTWKAVLGIVLIFILGWFGGALTTLIIAHHRMLVVIQHDPEPMAKLLERQTLRNLGLDENHTSQVHALIVENLRQRMELQKQIQPQVREVNGQTLRQIEALLTSGQQQQFHENLAKFKKRFGRNPFNATAEDKTAPAATPESHSPATNTPAANSESSAP